MDILLGQYSNLQIDILEWFSNVCKLVGLLPWQIGEMPDHDPSA